MVQEKEVVERRAESVRAQNQSTFTALVIGAKATRELRACGVSSDRDAHLPLYMFPSSVKMTLKEKKGGFFLTKMYAGIITATNLGSASRQSAQ